MPRTWLRYVLQLCMLPVTTTTNRASITLSWRSVELEEYAEHTDKYFTVEVQGTLYGHLEDSILRPNIFKMFITT